MTPVTPHFSVEEFACKDGTAYPVDRVDDEDPQHRTWLVTRLTPLCETLEAIRGGLGGSPLHIDSGYRTLAYDQKLYDADRASGGHLVAKPQGSQHPKGRAADVRSGSLLPVQLRDLILGLYKGGKLPHLGGLGLYPTFVHVDVRPRFPVTHLAQWGGSRLSNVV